MQDFVFYLTDSLQKEKPGLVFPSEIDSDDYSGPGQFYLVTGDRDALQDTYKIHAYKEDEFVVVELKRNNRDSNIYSGLVDNKIGTFSFVAREMEHHQSYVGNVHKFKGFQFRYRLYLDSQQAENAALSFDFYFLGYTPFV